jgi:hypothetical protein
MRILLLPIAAASLLTTYSANAQPPGGDAPDHVDACAELRGGTPGLYGLCVSYCRQQDLSDVDLNDIASVRAAAPDVKLLENYNRRRRNGDPEMPCFANSSSSDDPPPPTDEPPPPPAMCPCWTGQELGSLDGELPPRDGYASAAECVALDENGVVYRQQVSEGYDLGLLLTVEGVAWASVDSGGQEPYNGCFFSNATSQKNFPLEQTDAAICVQDVVNHCAALGNP